MSIDRTTGSTVNPDGSDYNAVDPQGVSGTKAPGVNQTQDPDITFSADTAGNSTTASKQEGRPELPPPTVSDSADELMRKFTEIYEQIQQGQLEFSKDNVDDLRRQREAKQNEINKKLDQAAVKIRNAKAWGTFAKIAGWIATGIASVIGVAVGVLVTAATLGTGAAVFVGVFGAICAAASLALTITGAADKLTESITNALKQQGMSDTAATIFANVISTGAMLCLDLMGSIGPQAIVKATVGGGIKAAMAAVRETAKTVINAIIKTVKDMITKGVLKTTQEILKAVKDVVLNALGNLVMQAMKKFNEFVEGVKNFPKSLSGAVKAVGAEIQNIFNKALAAIQAKLESGTSTVGKALLEFVAEEVEKFVKSVIGDLKALSAAFKPSCWKAVLKENPKVLNSIGNVATSAVQSAKSVADIKTAVAEKDAELSQLDANALKVDLAKMASSMDDLIEQIVDGIESQGKMVGKLAETFQSNSNTMHMAVSI